MEILCRGRELFTTWEWKQFLIRSVGFEPASLTPRAQDVLLLRMIPFVERNYNTVELGPRGTGILNQPPPGPVRESVKFAEQNLYSRGKTLVGDRDPREHEFSVQLRAFDAAKAGTGLGVPALLALCSALLEKNLKGGWSWSVR